jgi:hypothetical protein
MRNLFRSAAACIAALGILFSQVALAAYACPMEFVAAAASAEPADCCLEEAAATASLCEEHCKDSKASTADNAPASVDFVPAFTVWLTRPAGVSQPPNFSSPTLVHATSPPLSILNCCFRI